MDVPDISGKKREGIMEEERRNGDGIKREEENERDQDRERKRD